MDGGPYIFFAGVGQQSRSEAASQLQSRPESYLLKVGGMTARHSQEIWGREMSQNANKAMITSPRPCKIHHLGWARTGTSVQRIP